MDNKTILLCLSSLSILLLLYALTLLALSLRQPNKQVQKSHDLTFNTKQSTLWKTASWPTLFGLYDLHILSVLPTGPCNAATAGTFAAWPEKRYLRRLLHMGILPLSIRDGGVTTHRKTSLRFAPTFPYVPWVVPVYTQTRRRAVFEFVIPRMESFGSADECTEERDAAVRTFVRKLVMNRHGYLVCVYDGGRVVEGSVPAPDAEQPVEVEGTSVFKGMLPLKGERVVRGGKGMDGQEVFEFLREGACPLLEKAKGLVVRVEVAYCGPARLDQWVYGVAQECGMGRVWKEGVLHAHASQWMLLNGLRLPGYLVPVKDSI